MSGMAASPARALPGISARTGSVEGRPHAKLARTRSAAHAMGNESAITGEACKLLGSGILLSSRDAFGCLKKFRALLLIGTGRVNPPPWALSHKCF